MELKWIDSKSQIDQLLKNIKHIFGKKNIGHKKIKT